jgi:hypothetical protein
MIEWARFLFIVAVAAADHLWYETVLSFNTTRDFVRYRLRWIVRDKLRAMVGGRR